MEGAAESSKPNTDPASNSPVSEDVSRSLLGRMKYNWANLREKYRPLMVVSFLSALFLFALFYDRIIYNIQPGESGVIWKRFYGGTDLNQVYGEGIHFIFPWDKLYIYDTRIQQVPFSFYALSANGLPINFDVSIRYRPFIRTLPVLHQNVGPDYVERIVKPEVQAHVRAVVANFFPEQVYTSEGQLLPIIKQGATFSVAERNVLLDDLLIKRITLPEYIQHAIERKLEQEQLALEYEFRLQREEQEAERKRIEAAGIRDFQRTVVAGGAFNQYLTFVGVQASLALAKSDNAKVVIFGGGEGGQLPLILNMGDQTSGPMNFVPPELVDQQSAISEVEFPAVPQQGLSPSALSAQPNRSERNQP